MDTNASNYVVVEDFISAEDAAALCSAILSDPEEDPKPHFRGLGIGGIELLKDRASVSWDTNKRLLDVLDYAEKHFNETYNILGTLEFNRIYGNIMDEGAFLPSHRDEDPNPAGEYDGKKRSFVAALFLNDDYEGGEILFEDQGAALKPKPGTLVLFPGFYTNHGVNEVLKGSRVNILAFFYDMLS